jgi:hypothetical protein
MIWTADAKKLLDEFDQGDLLTLDSLTIQAGDTTLSGRGTLKWENGRFAMTARFGLGTVPGVFAQSQFGGMQKPRFYSRDEFWKMEARTSNGASLACEVGPPHGWTDGGDGVTEIRCHIDKLILSPKLLDATDFRCFEALLEKFNEPGALENGEINVSLDPPETVPAKFHAILPGVKCVLAEHMTRIERHNVFLGDTSSSKRDTFVDENAERKIALIEKDGNLHVYLELPPGNRTEVTEKSIFSALIDAVAFTHGCQPYPRLKEYSRNGRVVCCEIRPVRELKTASIKPLSERAIHLGRNVRSMPGVAFEFFQRDQAIVSRIRKAMWLYRDAALEDVPLPVQVLTTCTLFEGLMQAIFDAHNLKGPTSSSDNSVAFRNAKKATIRCLNEQHTKAGYGPDSESPWRRFAGYLNGLGYVRPKERMMAVAGCFGFQWAGDVEEIFEIWNRHRHGLAHGAEVKEDIHSIGELFLAWSRLSGAIHRFILAEMGYVGSFSYSPMESGLEVLDFEESAREEGQEADSAGGGGQQTL